LYAYLSTPQKAFSFQKPEDLKEIGIFACSLRDRTLAKKGDLYNGSCRFKIWV